MKLRDVPREGSAGTVKFRDVPREGSAGTVKFRDVPRGGRWDGEVPGRAARGLRGDGTDMEEIWFQV